MHRIDGPGHINNRFSAGNPQLGQRATMVTSDWLNDVQENIVDVLRFANIDPVKGDETQLRDAIVALIAGVVGTGGGSVSTTRQVNGGGLVTGGGALAANLTLTVDKATPAEITTGAIDTKAITPLSLSQALGSNRAAGYMPLPGGVLIQWGVLTAQLVGDAPVLVTLPTAFSGVNYALTTNVINQGGEVGADIWSQVITKTVGSFSAFLQKQQPDAIAVQGLEWHAIGRFA